MELEKTPQSDFRICVDMNASHIPVQHSTCTSLYAIIYIYIYINNTYVHTCIHAQYTRTYACRCICTHVTLETEWTPLSSKRAGAPFLFMAQVRGVLLFCAFACGVTVGGCWFGGWWRLVSLVG